MKHNKEQSNEYTWSELHRCLEKILYLARSLFDAANDIGPIEDSRNLQLDLDISKAYVLYHQDEDSEQLAGTFYYGNLYKYLNLARLSVDTLGQLRYQIHRAFQFLSVGASIEQEYEVNFRMDVTHTMDQPLVQLASLFNAFGTALVTTEVYKLIHNGPHAFVYRYTTNYPIKGVPEREIQEMLLPTRDARLHHFKRYIRERYMNPIQQYLLGTNRYLESQIPFPRSYIPQITHDAAYIHYLIIQDPMILMLADVFYLTHIQGYLLATIPWKESAMTKCGYGFYYKRFILRHDLEVGTVMDTIHEINHQVSAILHNHYNFDLNRILRLDSGESIQTIGDLATCNDPMSYREDINPAKLCLRRGQGHAHFKDFSLDYAKRRLKDLKNKPYYSFIIEDCLRYYAYAEV